MKQQQQGSLWGRLPKLEPLVVLDVKRGDVLVHAPGFEDRTLGIVDTVREGSGLKCILLDYRPFDSSESIDGGAGGPCEKGGRV